MEYLELGVITTIIGMGVVFGVLVLLCLIIFALVKVLNPSKNPTAKPTATKAAPAAKAVAAPAPIAAPLVEATVAMGIDRKTIAAIMAAVTMASGSSNLRFTAIRRGNKVHSQWGDNGTASIISTRRDFMNN